MRQEVTTAHAGHKEQVEQIVANTDQLQNQLRAIEQTDQLPLNGSDSKSRNGSATTDGKIDFTDAALPQVAARGGMDALTVDEDDDDEDEFPNLWAKWRYNVNRFGGSSARLLPTFLTRRYFLFCPTASRAVRRVHWNGRSHDLWQRHQCAGYRQQALRS